MLASNRGIIQVQCVSEGKKDQDLRIGYCAGTLNADLARAFELHMANCEACRRACDEQQAMWDILGDWEPGSIPEDFNRKVFKRIESWERQPWWKRWLGAAEVLQWRSVASFAAVAAMVVFLVMMRPKPAAESPRQGPKAAAAQKEEPVDANQLEQALEDLRMLRHLSAGAGEKL